MLYKQRDAACLSNYLGPWVTLQWQYSPDNDVSRGHSTTSEACGVGIQSVWVTIGVFQCVNVVIIREMALRSLIQIKV